MKYDQKDRPLSLVGQPEEGPTPVEHLKEDDTDLRSSESTSANLIPVATPPDRHLEAHPLANLFPTPTDAEFLALINDVLENGLHDPIVLYQGKILEGRTRHKVCRAAGLQPRYMEYVGDSPVAFVLSKNMHRRHMTPSQRAVLALDVHQALMEEKTRLQEDRQACSSKVAIPPPTGDPDHRPKTRDHLARVAGVSARTIQDARKVQQEAPDLIPAIQAGKSSVNGAIDTIRRRTKGAQTGSSKGSPGGNPPSGSQESSTAEASPTGAANKKTAATSANQASAADSLIVQDLLVPVQQGEEGSQDDRLRLPVYFVQAGQRTLVKGFSFSEDALLLYAEKRVD